MGRGPPGWHASSTQHSSSNWHQSLPSLAGPASAPCSTVQPTGTACTQKQSGIRCVYGSSRRFRCEAPKPHGATQPPLQIPSFGHVPDELYSLLNFWSAVNKLMVPELERWVFYQLNERNKETPRMRPIYNQSFQENPEIRKQKSFELKEPTHTQKQREKLKDLPLT